jgi:hypothetical protein
MSEPNRLPVAAAESHSKRLVLLAAMVAAMSLGVVGAAREPDASDGIQPKAQTRSATLKNTAVAVSRDQPAPSRSAAHRVADSSMSPALFAPHSWHVEPPPVPLPPPPPPPPPTAPPLPFTYVGQYTPQGDATVYFLANADRVIDAHIGDQLDGTYTFESADAAQLIFNYMPLNIRQSLPVGAKQ